MLVRGAMLRHRPVTRPRARSAPGRGSSLDPDAVRDVTDAAVRGPGRVPVSLHGSDLTIWTPGRSRSRFFAVQSNETRY